VPSILSKSATSICSQQDEMELLDPYIAALGPPDYFFMAGRSAKMHSNGDGVYHRGVGTACKVGSCQTIRLVRSVSIVGRDCLRCPDMARDLTN
jgi:hypothetical protein